MKIFKKLLIASLVVSCFFLTTDVNAQGKNTMTHYDVIQYYTCFDEVIKFDVYFNEFDKGNNYHYNIVKCEAVGQTTGYNYIVNEVNNGAVLGTFNLRIIGPKGKMFFIHGVWNKNKTEVVFYCF